MTIKKKRSPIVRALGFAAALILVVALLPFNALDLIAFAATSLTGDYNYITIDGYDSNSGETVNKGSEYYIRSAYIGGTESKEWKIGDTNLNGNTLASEVTLDSSSITVTYGGNAVTTDTDSTGEYFTASKQGTYTVTYAYTYTTGGLSYTNSYDLTVESVVSSVSISIPSDGEYVLPSVIDLDVFDAAVKDGTRTTSNIYIPKVEVTDEDGEEVDGIEYVRSLSEATSSKVVVVTVSGGNNSEQLYSTTNNYLLYDTENNLYIDSDVFDDTLFGVGSYEVKFSYYENGIFVNSTTKTIDVRDEYYEDYAIELNLETDWTDNGETGVENDLPVATAVTASTTTPASESVDVVYKVEVKFYATDSKASYAALDTTIYNTDPENPVLYVEDEKTYLVDPTSFKPLQDGYYTFIYTITDFYGNTKTSDVGQFVYDNITDETDPTPVLYDASEYDGETYVDASDKFVTRAVANGIIVYAIGIDDNVSTASDATLIRKVMTSSTVKFTIEDYDVYNLVFNYYSSTSGDAWSELLANNYQLRKLESDAIASGDLSAEIDNDADMLSFLNDNGFLIVIDNSNYKVIYGYFQSTFDAIEGVSSEATLLSWLQSADEATIASYGFAYIDVDETFGAAASQSNIEDGMGTGYYYVHYIATDAAGNETDSSHRIYIVESFTDDTSPEITFSTTLKKSYSTGSTITFTAPSATDTIDSNLSVKTLYRYLDEDGKVITNDTLAAVPETENEVILDNDGEAATLVDVSWIVDDLYAKTDDDGGFTREKYKEFVDDYADYLLLDDPSLGQSGWEIDYNAGGYIELTDSSASSYSIALENAPTGTNQVQILVYVYDDSGNVALLGKTVNVANSNDTEPLLYKTYSYTVDTTAVYNQSETIELPTLVVKDDAIDYVSFVAGVIYTATDGTTTDITPSGYKVTNPNNSAYQMKIYGGSFVASYVGNYTAYIAVTDDAGNMVVAFSAYTVEGVDVVQTPEFSGLTMEKTQSYEVDDYAENETIEIDIPTVTYEISNSVTYDKYDSSTAAADGITTVIQNVNADGTFVSYNTGYSMSNELNVHNIYKNGGTATIIYTANVITYEIATFSYEDESYASDGNYYALVSGAYATTGLSEIYVSTKGNYVLYIGSTYYVLIEEYDADEEEDVWHMYVSTYDGEITDDTALNAKTTLGTDLDLITENIKIYHLVSDTYTITVTDTTDPVIANYDYSAIAKSDTSTYLHVYGLEATDTNLDKDQCSITISCTLASGSKSSKTLSGSDAFVDYGVDESLGEGYELARDSAGDLIDGTYKITYTAVDKSGNTTTNVYTIAVGDNTPPTITIADGFCEDSYEIGTLVKLDLTLIEFYDASGYDPDSITYTLTNSSGETIAEDSTSTDVLLVYDLDEVDTYTFTITFQDLVGWSTTKSVEFTVEAKSTDSTSVYQIVGIILIVISVLVLVGVIVYFIVSKVKLDKELKK